MCKGSAFVWFCVAVLRILDLGVGSYVLSCLFSVKVSAFKVYGLICLEG